VTAVVRSAQMSTISGASGTATRGVASIGDILIAFQSADSGGNDALDMGGDWLFSEFRPGGAWDGSQSGEWAGTVVWTRVCRANEPTSYPVFQGPVASGVVTIVAIAGAVRSSLRIQDASGTRAPSAIPSGASGVELRYATGVPGMPGASVTWTVPSGYTKRAEAQVDVWTTAVLASRPIVSTASTGTARLDPSADLAANAWTVLLESEAAVVPDPPVVQPFAPGKGVSQYRYVFTRLLDRTYLGDLDLVGVSFDKRILQAGAFSATIPIPNRRIGDQVAEIIPRDDTALSIGPGVITCQVYRSGEPWGEYWITSAQPSRSRRGTPAISLRGSTLDAYLAHVQLQQDQFFAGDDQIDIARGLLNNMMGLPNANVGLALQDGLSGVTRERTYLESESATYGQRLVELAQVDDGFEWMINLELDNGVLVRRWVYGYPKLGVQSPAPHLFADGRSGGDILEWAEEIDALRGATRWRARGSSASTDASTTSEPLVSSAHEATAHLAAGWPRLDRTLNYSTVTDESTLDAYAAFWAATAAGAIRVDQVAVTFGKEPSLTPNDLGDAARFYYDNEWHRGVWRTRRILGIGVTPTSRATGKEEAKLVLEGLEVAGA
jgi:hypothetical protein